MQAQLLSYLLEMHWKRRSEGEVSISVGVTAEREEQEKDCGCDGGRSAEM